jgi:hypothetical protein
MQSHWRMTRWSAAAAAAVLAGVTLVAAPQARADGGVGGRGGFAIEGASNVLSADAPLPLGEAGLSMWPGTSPSIAPAQNAGNGYAVAFEGSNGDLWLTGSGPGAQDTGLGMMPGTSPSIAALSPGEYQVAFQANTGVLYTMGADGTTDWNLPMNTHSSPSIVGQGNGYEVAYESTTTELSEASLSVSGASHGGLGLGMQPGTSPSITALWGGGIEIAFQANTGTLWTVGTNSPATNTGQGMNQASSPSITGLPLNNTGYEIAFEANTNVLTTIGTFGGVNTGLAMMPGTSPAIIGTLVFPFPGAINPIIQEGYEIAFQGNTGTLWATSTSIFFGTQSGNTGLAMNGQSSPGIAPFVL